MQGSAKQGKFPTDPFDRVLGFPGGSDDKESACNVGYLGSTLGLGRSSGGGHGNSLQYSCLENPHEQRSLVSYSPWGRNELDTTERLSTAQYVEPYLKMLDLIDTVKLHPGLDCQYAP